jgi:hypothetical protein
MTHGEEFAFAHLSLEDLRVMLASVIASGPNQEDKDFLKRLVNEIARREKSSP